MITFLPIVQSRGGRRSRQVRALIDIAAEDRTDSDARVPVQDHEGLAASGPQVRIIPSRATLTRRSPRPSKPNVGRHPTRGRRSPVVALTALARSSTGCAPGVSTTMLEFVASLAHVALMPASSPPHTNEDFPLPDAPTTATKRACDSRPRRLGLCLTAVNQRCVVVLERA